jgi:steroid delta-isomerase-like uncharacterized protein
MASRTVSKTRKAPAKSPKELAEEAFEALGRGDIATVEQYWDQDIHEDFVAVGEFRGREAISAFFRETFDAFPDFSMEVERITAEGDITVIQWLARGTFTGGKFLGIEPTGRRVQMRGIDVMEWRDGKIVENTIYYDGATLARQIGMLPKRDSPADKAVLAGFNAVSKLKARIKQRRPA